MEKTANEKEGGNERKERGPRKPYEAPAISEEEAFERLALTVCTGPGGKADGECPLGWS